MTAQLLRQPGGFEGMFTGPSQAARDLPVTDGEDRPVSEPAQRRLAERVRPNCSAVNTVSPPASTFPPACCQNLSNMSIQSWKPCSNGILALERTEVAARPEDAVFDVMVKWPMN